MKLTPADVVRLVERWHEGAHYPELCDEFGVSRGTVRVRLRAAGVTAEEARTRSGAASWAARLDVPPDEGDVYTGSRTCSHCRERKPMTEFYWRGVAQRTRHRKCTKCFIKVCNSNLKLPANRRKHLYDMEQAEYDALMVEQGSACAICEIEFSEDVPPRVDHCHDTGGRRGLLCDQCNRGLGMFDDNVDILSAAVEYRWKYPMARDPWRGRERPTQTEVAS